MATTKMTDSEPRIKRPLHLVPPPSAANPERLIATAEEHEREAQRLRHAALRMLVLGIVRTEHDQDNRPVAMRSKATYRRAFHELEAEGHHGVRKVGRRLLMTTAAAETWTARHTRSRTKKSVVVEEPQRAVDADVLAELGAARMVPR